MPFYNEDVARRRFFVESISDGRAELADEEARHLGRVLRAEPGQKYEVSDGSAVWLAEITEAAPSRVVFRTIEPVEVAPLVPRITLCVALIKFDRLEWAIEKATELGVERILPVATARCEKGLFEASRKRSVRWRRIALESSQQSRRLAPPEILDAAQWKQALATAAPVRFFLDEAGGACLAACLPPERTPSDEVALLVGPEGGWTGSERAEALAAGWTPVSLGPRILRAETAVLAALSVLSSTWAI